MEKYIKPALEVINVELEQAFLEASQVMQIGDELVDGEEWD